PNSSQADFDGTPMVTDTMCDEDILCLAEVLRERNEGFIQITQATGNMRSDLDFVEKLADVAKRPILHNAIVPGKRNPVPHQKSLAWLEAAREKGLPIYGQCGTLRSGFAFTLEHWNLYDASPAWRELTTGTKEEKIEKLKDPKLRENVINETEAADRKLKAIQAGVGGAVPKLVITGVNKQPELEHYQGKSLEQVGKEENKHPVAVMLDLSLQTDLNAEFTGPDRGTNAEFMAEIMNNSDYTFPGVSDGGAHTKFFTGGGFTTDFLKWLVRDEARITLEEAHYRLSALPAKAAGFKDRGTLKQGAWADIVVYDLDKLDCGGGWVGDIAYDLPGGEWRRIQKAIGYRAIMVNGVVTFEDGECTGAVPGKLLRNGSAEKAAEKAA
ncbi:MAG: aminoacylase, partial [Cellvibrionales bacterium]